MNKNIFRRAGNRFLHFLARSLPGSLSIRPLLHRWRGVKIGAWVWIGDDVYLENEHPEHVEIEEEAILGIRCMIIAHTRGPGSVIIGRRASIGPGAIVICEGGRTLRIGEGAVICAGAIVKSSVAPGMVIAPPASVPVAKATIPFGRAESIQHFIGGLQPLKRTPAAGADGIIRKP
jgi:carbonic anhydrase/acetyltransferase-like protein (isoleucine patch superfamily)